MSDAAKYRAEMRSKAERLVNGKPGKIDASDYRIPTDLDADIKTGERPISRRAFKDGGKAEVEGSAADRRADRSQRKAGGALTANSLINRDVKAANEEREGKKHVGGFANGGRTAKAIGGGFSDPREDAMLAMEEAGKRAGVPTGRMNFDKSEAGVLRNLTGFASGGATKVTELTGVRSTGGRMAKKRGGKATNVNIIITQGPKPDAGGPGMAPAPTPAMPPMPPKLPAPTMPGPAMGAPPMGPAGGAPGGMPQLMRKHGGRAYPIDTGAGGANARMEKIKAYGLKPPK